MVIYLPVLRDTENFWAGSFYFIVGDSQKVADFLTANQDKITDFYLENDRRNSAIPLLDLTTVDARIEPGAFIRDQAIIEKNAVIMMGRSSILVPLSAKKQ